MRSSFVLFIIGVIFIMALRSSMAGMLSYWWFAYFRPQEWIWLDVSKFRLPLVATILFVVPSLIRGFFPEVKDKLAILMLLFLGTGIISEVVNGCGEQLKVIDEVQLLSVLFLCVFLTVRIVDSKLRLFYLIAVFGLSLSFYGTKAGIVSLLGGGATTYGVNNLTGLFSGSNSFAMGSAIYLFFLVFLMQQLTNKRPLKAFPSWFVRFPRIVKYVFYIAVIGNILNIISLSSRGSSLSVGIGLFLLYLLNDKRVKMFFIFLPFIIIMLVVVPIPDSYKDRMASVFSKVEDRDGSAASRPYFWRIANEMVGDYPIGVGPGCYRSHYNFYDTTNGLYGVNRVVHSTHFQILSENGYVGIIIWITLIIVSYRRLFRLRRLAINDEKKFESPLFYKQVCEALLCSQTVLLFGGPFYSFLYADHIWVIYSLGMIITKLMNREIKDKARDLMA